MSFNVKFNGDDDGSTNGFMKKTQYSDPYKEFNPISRRFTFLSNKT